jgi:hypothetical protein
MGDSRRAFPGALRKVHHPRWEVFYGKSYWAHWEAIAGRQMTLIQPYGFGFCRDGATQYRVIRHPAAWGSKNEEFIAAGKLIGQS